MTKKIHVRATVCLNLPWVFVRYEAYIGAIVYKLSRGDEKLLTIALEVGEDLVVDSITKPLEIFCDNTIAIFFSKTHKYSGGFKHIEIKYLITCSH
ncbi:hypothetical protein MUK42_27259 [Musa troglodytarum]|uniref:Uncharacterized protein n=1 Tax=Musa troglodytarum TaxID=320322 RepID=A0A9E7FB88_9LILI|nr:hypothetical protein MUK42_27259 [Musa troglodytarum]